MKHNNKRVHLSLVMGFAMFLAALLLFPTSYGTAVAGAEAPDKAAV